MDHHPDGHHLKVPVATPAAPTGPSSSAPRGDLDTHPPHRSQASHTPRAATGPIGAVPPLPQPFRTRGPRLNRLRARAEAVQTRHKRGLCVPQTKDPLAAIVGANVQVPDCVHWSLAMRAGP